MRIGVVYLAVGLELLTSSGEAQIYPADPPMSLYTHCINQAIQTGSIVKVSTYIKFMCFEEDARSLFAELGQHNRKDYSVLVHSTGQWRTRFVEPAETKFEDGSDDCRQHIENPDGSPADGYKCDIFLSVSSFLNE